MLRLIGLMLSIGFVDSLNPSTVAPALYLATLDRRKAQRQVIQFTAGVSAVYLLGGLLIALGPGQLLLSLVPRPSATLRYALEVLAGVVLLAGSAWLWHRRRHLARRRLPQPRTHGRSAVLIGATISLVELPTAFPYFAAIAAAVGSGYNAFAQAVLIVVFNVMFVLPLLAIIAVLRWAGDDAERHLARGRAWMERRWPVVLAVIGALGGLFVLYLGLGGLLGVS